MAYGQVLGQSYVTTTQLNQSLENYATVESLENYLQKSGGTMTGPLTLNGNPTSNLQAATKQYVDNNRFPEMTLVQTETFSATGNKTQTYTFNSTFANLQTSYQFMVVAISGTVSNIGNGYLMLFGDQLFYPGNANTYVVNSNNPVILFLAKHGLDYNDGICYCGLLHTSENLIEVADKSGNASTFNVMLTNVSGSSPSVSLTIKLYGWNPI